MVVAWFMFYASTLVAGIKLGGRILRYFAQKWADR